MGKSETLEASGAHTKMYREHDWPNVDSLTPLYTPKLKQVSSL